MIAVRTRDELDKMRAAGRIVADALEDARVALRPGVSTKEVDDVVRECIVGAGGIPLFLNYRGFPANACISINEQVVHGIPKKRRKLKDGDIVSIDVGVKLRGYCGDSAWTFPVGEVEESVSRLLAIGEEALYRGIGACRDGCRVSDIGRAIQTFVEGAGYYVVKKYVGHGIGRKLHEDPQVPNYVSAGFPKQDPVLRTGNVVAIEPMVNEGTEDVERLDDGWTVVTADRKLSVHFEHTVAFTDAGPRILTQREDG